MKGGGTRVLDDAWGRDRSGTHSLEDSRAGIVDFSGPNPDRQPRVLPGFRSVAAP